MSEISGSLQHQNPTFHSSVFHVLDPISLILSHNSSDSLDPIPLKLTTESYIMERGPKYRAYAELRESKLRMKSWTAAATTTTTTPLYQHEYQETESESWRQTPPKKQVKFQHQPNLAATASSRKVAGSASLLAQSVPDFSATLRKENRKPPAVHQLTPPPSKNWSKVQGLLPSRGSKSASSGEKRIGNGGLMARKSYANVEELKGLSAAASNAIINGESRGGSSSRGVGGSRGGGVGKTVLGYRQF